MLRRTALITWPVWMAFAVVHSLGLTTVRADAFDEYALVRNLQLPGAGPFDALPDGRIVVLVGSQVFAESEAHESGVFSSLGNLPTADIAAPEAAFLIVSPDGQRLAVGNNGGASFTNYQVGVFLLADLTGTWFPAAHAAGAWVDDDLIALSAFGGQVTVLDTASPDPLSPDIVVVVENIGGASAGVLIDPAGRLFTGNGFIFEGPSLTGTVKAFEPDDWMAALDGGAAADFEARGTEIVVALSALSPVLDTDGSLVFGGSDFLADPARPPLADAVAVVRGAALAAVLAGNGPVDVSDASVVRFLDPDVPADNFFSVAFNSFTAELYARDFASATVHVMADARGVPAMGTTALMILTLSLLLIGRAVIRSRQSSNMKLIYSD